jgi:hypothetical protein
MAVPDGQPSVSRSSCTSSKSRSTRESVKQRVLRWSGLAACSRGSACNPVAGFSATGFFSSASFARPVLLALQDHNAGMKKGACTGESMRLRFRRSGAWHPRCGTGETGLRLPT